MSLNNGYCNAYDYIIADGEYNKINPYNTNINSSLIIDSFLNFTSQRERDTICNLLKFHKKRCR